MSEKLPDSLAELREESRPDRANGQRIRNAAVLLVVNTSGKSPKVLMGKRHGSMAFMANKVVFPGGRVERADHRLAVPFALDPVSEAGLAHGVRSRMPASLPRALALAAIRETAEEAGAYLAHRPGSLALDGANVRSRAPVWQSLLADGYLPAIDRLRFFARAITPPGRPRRFDTRFFLCDAENIAHDAQGTADGELGGVGWMDFDTARSAKDVPRITRVILDEAETRLEELKAGPMQRPLPFFHTRRGRFTREWIPAGVRK